MDRRLLEDDMACFAGARPVCCSGGRLQRLGHGSWGFTRASCHRHKDSKRSVELLKSEQCTFEDAWPVEDSSEPGQKWGTTIDRLSGSMLTFMGRREQHVVALP